MNNVNIARRPTYHHGNLRAALVKAGMRAVAEHGMDGFTLRDVARRAGVTAPAVYRHFKDKEELLAAVAGECAERLFSTIEEAVARERGDALARFRASGIAYVLFALGHPEHFRVLTVPGLFERAPAEQQARIARSKELQRADLAAGQAAGEIADIPLDELILGASSLVHGLAHLIVEGELGDVTPARARELAIAATGVLGEGLSPRDKPPADPLRPSRGKTRSR